MTSTQNQIRGLQFEALGCRACSLCSSGNGGLIPCRCRCYYRFRVLCFRVRGPGFRVLSLYGSTPALPQPVACCDVLGPTGLLCSSFWGLLWFSGGGIISDVYIYILPRSGTTLEGLGTTGASYFRTQS